MKLINLIIKPTSECNLRCAYCYHAETNYACGTMKIEKLKKLFDLASNEYETIRVTWHGGEPMLLGKKYISEVLKYQKQLEKEKNVSFTNAMQTNGTLITLSWCRFFKKHKILPGISFDGPTNDINRSNSKDIYKSFKRMKFSRMSVGCLAVVNKNNLNQIELYTEMKKYANNLKFNPVFSTDHHPDFEIDVNDYIKSTTELFDYWLYDKDGIILEPLSLYMSKALGLPHSSCANSSCLGKWLDIDSKGVIRTCGQSQDEPFIIGHLDEVEKLSDVFMSEQFNNLLTKAIARREKCKSSCKFFLECQGNCLFKSYIENGIEELNGFSCKAFRGIYGYIKMKTIELLKNKVPLDTLNPIAKKIIADAISSNPKFISGIING